MRAWTIPLASDPDPTAIDLHHRHRRPRRHGGCELLVPQRFDLLIAERLQLMAHLDGEPIELPTADRHFGEVRERGGRLLERRLPGTGAEGLSLNRRTKAVGIQA